MDVRLLRRVPTPPPSYENGRGLNEDAASYLEVQRAKGAQGVKIGKYLGLDLKDSQGEHIPVDDKRLYPYWAKAGELGMPVLIHTADPMSFFQKMGYQNPHYPAVPPQWDYSREFGVAGHGRLIAELTHIVRDHPETNRLLELFYKRHWPVFETSRFDLIDPYGRWEEWLRLCSANLPEDVLERVYFRNAERLLP